MNRKSLPALGAAIILTFVVLMHAAVAQSQPSDKDLDACDEQLER
jgi:hypothetical protein